MKKKFVFLGDLDSINIELIHNSHNYLKNKIEYILLGNIKDASKYLSKINSKIEINEIYNPLNFENYKKNNLNFFNIENIYKEKYQTLLNQLSIANHLSNSTQIDLVTLPINKSVFKKKIEFTGMTEYLAKINSRDTIMLMHGEKFSAIPLTTHINLKDVSKYLNKKYLNLKLTLIIKQIQRRIYELNFKSIKFLCYNPHCSEQNTIGNEDRKITEIIKKFKNIYGPLSADSAFNKIQNNLLFISMYHDQVLIPFKIINKKGINLTLGLNYRRLSPAHGTARDIKYKNIANLSSYIACMNF
ncbi:4-hydroxythreonine-4-phosphate dehydrogenase PdxA [Alphaproteobacteria bacterium]|nr:4-hydroxythreonine-4-phosphate dehydrogenase PdxA [Alphaproteobacteria bacterium]